MKQFETACIRPDWRAFSVESHVMEVSVLCRIIFQNIRLLEPFFNTLSRHLTPAGTNPIN